MASHEITIRFNLDADRYRELLATAERSRPRDRPEHTAARIACCWAAEAIRHNIDAHTPPPDLL